MFKENLKRESCRHRSRSVNIAIAPAAIKARVILRCIAQGIKHLRFG